MTEEVQKDIPNNVSEPEQKEYTPVEQEAMAQGWVPKDDYSGEDHKWVDAGEFIRRGELFQKIESQKQHQRRQDQEILALKAHLKTVADSEYKRAVEALKAERKAARDEGDFDRVDEVNEKLEEAKQTAVIKKQQLDTEVEAPRLNPEFVQWVGRNTWYESAPHMKVFADELGNRLAQQGLTPAEVLKKVEVEVRKEFPNKFKNPNQERPSATEGSTPTRGASKANSDSIELSDMERNIMNTLVRGGHMTKEAYIADLKKTRGV
jgi:hypothetical protein